MSYSIDIRCKPIQQKDGRWFCPECKHTGPRIFHRVCGWEDPVNLNVPFIREVEAKKRTPQEYLERTHHEGRTLEEQLELLSQCEKCVHFKRTYCSQDKGCDRRVMLLIRLAKRECEKWQM